MKRFLMMFTAVLLTLALLSGCGAEQPVQTDDTTESTAAPTVTTAAPTTEDVEYEGDASSYYIDVVYTRQIDRYYKAISEQWDETKYIDL